jgi:hypothetical protein
MNPIEASLLNAEMTAGIVSSAGLRRLADCTDTFKSDTASFAGHAAATLGHRPS